MTLAITKIKKRGNSLLSLNAIVDIFIISELDMDMIKCMKNIVQVQ